jgi:hypothetical protein
MDIIRKHNESEDSQHMFHSLNAELLNSALILQQILQRHMPWNNSHEQTSQCREHVSGTLHEEYINHQFVVRYS